MPADSTDEVDVEFESDIEELPPEVAEAHEVLGPKLSEAVNALIAYHTGDRPDEYTLPLLDEARTHRLNAYAEILKAINGGEFYRAADGAMDTHEAVLKAVKRIAESEMGVD